MTIDWNAPLEAYHPDGRVVEVLGGYRGYRQNIHPDPQIDGGRNYTFSGDGDHFASEWRIRNRTTKPANAPSQELVERMVACIRAVSQMPWPRQAEKARAILAELELVDPDLELAREVAVESCIGHSDGWANDVREGKHDDYGEVRAALAAIKRVRAEKG